MIEPKRSKKLTKIDNTKVIEQKVRKSKKININCKKENLITIKKDSKFKT